MKKILGLDLGSNSIGWAVVDDEQSKILGTGVRIFPEGVENRGMGQKEKSKNASRREHRQTRRQYFRKRLRKAKLLELLIKHDMCPLTVEELKPWKCYNKSEGKAGVKFPSTKVFNEWLTMNPYQLRKEGLERNLTRKEFGRVLYHLIQRRGFWSNRKVKDDGALTKGKDNVVGIKETKEILENSPTLGSSLYHISCKDGKPFRRIKNEEGKDQRVRARYTLRKWYIDEYEKLWERQAKHLELDKVTEFVKKVYHIGNPYNEGREENGLKKRITHRLEYLKNKGIRAELTNTDGTDNTKLVVGKQVFLKELFGGGEIIKQEDSVLFYQRPLRNQKFLLDECSFERTIWKYNGALVYQRKKPGEGAKIIYAGKKPCAISHPLFELRRAYEFINNIEYGERIWLNDKQRKTVLSLINSKDGNFDFKNIPEILKLEHEKFNYDDKHKVPGNYTHKHVKPLFSEDTWKNHSEEIWHCFHFYTEPEQLIKKLQKDFGLKKKDFDKVMGNIQDDGTRKGGIILKGGYKNLSLKAIKNILPFLEKEKGYRYSDAVLLGGVKNVFKSRWKYFENRQEEIENAVIAINKDESNKEGEAVGKIKEYLVKNDFGFEQDDITFYGLYHHSQNTEKQEMKDKLDDPENLRNPLVQQALWELKGIITLLSKEYLKEGERFAQIKVEMARDLKQSRQKRIDQFYENQQKQKENDKARAVLDEFGLSYSRNNIHKYLIWKELQNENGYSVCPYTGKTINITDLFNDNKFQIEHIIPYSKSLDDSFANKTICDAEENGRKGENTPYEFYGSHEKKWEEIAERAFRVLPYRKAKRFTSKTSHETDFITRQLNDTRYISKAAKDYMKQICMDVRVFPGQLTANLRNKWGLDNILNSPTEVKDNTNFGRVWAQVDGNGEAVAFYPIFNNLPEYEKAEFVITGEMKNETFESKYLAVEFNANGQPDGKYWAKIKVGDAPVKLVKILRPLPETAENEILLYGKTDEKGKYNTKYISQKLDGEELEKETAYMALLTVRPGKTQIFNIRDKKMPKSKKNSVLLNGKVKNGIFLSRIHTCRANVDDGIYTALLEVNLEGVSFHKVKNSEPEFGKKQIRVVGNVKEGKFLPNIARKDFYDAFRAVDGLHWALFEIRSKRYKFTIIKNPEPKVENSELVEGTIALANLTEVDKETGELMNEEDTKYFFPAKERSDHRHHAIDALVIAMTKQGYLQRLSAYNANKEEKKRGNQYDKSKLKFPMPWEGFREDAEQHIKRILVSHKKVSRVLTKKKTRNPKTGIICEGIGARGQLHDKTFYGKNKHCEENEFVNRVALNKLKYANTKGQAVYLHDIIDFKVKTYILDQINEFLKKEEAVLKVFNEVREKERTLSQIAKKSEKEKEAKKINDLKRKIKDSVEELLDEKEFFMPNEGKRYKRLKKKDDGSKRDPVPIKKVRVKRKKENVQFLKETNGMHLKKTAINDYNQYVNPGNNHHVMIYKDYNGNIRENVETFWTIVKRKKQGLSEYKLPEDGAEIVTTLHVNDMFLLGLKDEDIDWDDREKISHHLFRVQKFTSGDYYFRFHLASTINNDSERIYIKNFGDGKTGWLTYNPIKVKLTSTGQIEPIRLRTGLAAY